MVSLSPLLISSAPLDCWARLLRSSTHLACSSNMLISAAQLICSACLLNSSAGIVASCLLLISSGHLVCASRLLTSSTQLACSSHLISSSNIPCVRTRTYNDGCRRPISAAPWLRMRGCAPPAPTAPRANANCLNMFVGATSNGILGLAQPGRRRVKAGGRHIRQQWFEQPTRGATHTRNA